MKAAVLESYNHFVWKDVETPKVKPGEVLVRIRFASICGTDMHASQIQKAFKLLQKEKEKYLKVLLDFR
jgi:D-arabinose 1-dehydrogenase-like Zn-dependent alcohol dehydrogenase